MSRYTHGYTEWQPWQQECRVCERVKCPTPEKVGEWLETLVKDLHAMVSPDLFGDGGWRFQAASYESFLQVYTSTWSWALRGVCPDCIDTEAPALAEYLDWPERVHFDAAVRWACLCPDYPAVGVVRAHTPDGLVSVAAAWRGRGLAVHPSVSFSYGPKGFGWVVTHERSGQGIRTCLESQDEAVALAQLLGEVADWELLEVDFIRTNEAFRRQVHAVLELLAVGGAS